MSSQDTSVDTFAAILYTKEIEYSMKMILDKNLFRVASRYILEKANPDPTRSYKELGIDFYPIKYGTEYERTKKPEGMISMKGEEYIPDPNLEIALKAHPAPKVIGYEVVIKDFEEEVFRGNFSFEDLFRGMVEYFMKAGHTKGFFKKEEGPYYFEVRPGKESSIKIMSSNLTYRSLLDKNYDDPDAFPIPTLDEGRKRISFRKVAIDPLPIFEEEQILAAKKRGKRGKECRGRVLLHKAVYKHLIQEAELSDTEESGGYLVGQAYRQAGSPEDESHEDFRWAIELTDFISAEETLGNPGLLLFTPSSWSRLNEKIDEDYTGKKLLSWFHTHLFEATNDFGLSSLDQDLHKQFFTKPWQVALLINMSIVNGKRELRCFQRDWDSVTLVESTYEVISLKEA